MLDRLQAEMQCALEGQTQTTSRAGGTDLTQVPCRKAIAEVVKANKNKKSLQLTYEVAKLFQIVMTDENSTLSKEDWKRYLIITKLFMIRDLRHLECIDSFTNGLMGR